MTKNHRYTPCLLAQAEPRRPECADLVPLRLEVIEEYGSACGILYCPDGAQQERVEVDRLALTD